ncbi:hypothetical protein L0657_18360 [Dyadobacter sp. CY345]|uniref:hypothetical protein n=1 Tax=Dyadobacter sp. CY345 TaxID=2909335 RepID=UPI001F32C52C|nr:hypothetical protein [Dyadobacter sp. CY345]MCF2445931.1 hypothetical protein [Dyadobacter sp. CY345]
MNKLVFLMFAIETVLCTCNPDKRTNGFEKVKSHYKISKIGKLPIVANESSGIARTGKGTYWTHNDSGGKTELYEIDSTGKLLSTKVIPNSQNTDWEDLTRDETGNIYIGDFGNNGNSRRSLTIYKVPSSGTDTEEIMFNYADQKEFPPSKDLFNFDCEAFFHHNDNLYLFSKNRSPKNHFVRLYKLPSQKGNYSITPIDSIEIKTQVTSADISPDGKTFALLTYGKILLFEIDNGLINFRKPKGCFRFVRKQAEALTFVSNTDMIVTNEQQQIFRITYR